MLDFTKEIKLEKNLKKKYLFLKGFLYFFFIVAYAIFAYRTVFPSIGFPYDFKNEGSLKNTIFNPRYSEKEILAKGNYERKAPLIFDAALIGNFSNVTVSLTLDKNSPLLVNGEFSVRKSYRDFFYPVGKPVGFKDGTLISNNEEYFAVSNGKIRKFPSFLVMQNLGFSKSMFTAVSDKELALQTNGDEISTEDYPSGTIFKIEDDYLQLLSGQLYKFISPKAYGSQYSTQYAILKSSDILKKYPSSEKLLGYSDGTLAATSQAIYILSKGKAYPFDSPLTFEALGYNWNDVIQVSSDEIGLYEIQKNALNNQPHPDGTVFLDTMDQKYYLIENNEKLPLLGEEIISSYLRGAPIKADSRSLNIKQSCKASKHILDSLTYSCQMQIENFNNYPGNDFQFVGNFDNNLKLDSLDATFFTAPNFKNILSSISKMKNRVGDNYLGN